jgi:hypothetical protein
MVRVTEKQKENTQQLIKAMNRENLNIERINFYINKGVDLESKDKDGKTILHLAVAVGDINIIDRLIVAGADVNDQDNEGKTPLHYAYIYGRPDIKAILEENVANDIQDKSGVKPSELVMPTRTIILDENNQIPDGGKRSRRRRRRTQRKSKRNKQTRRRK